MKYKIKQHNKTQKIIEFQLSKQMISGELNRIYNEVAKTATLPGFRTGKAPLELIKKRYKKKMDEEAIQNLVKDSFGSLISKTDMEFLGLPEISDLTFDEEKGMSYKAVVNMKPRINLRGYKGLKLNKQHKEIKESDIDSELEALREMSAKFQTKEGSAEDGDYIIADLRCAIDGHPVEEKKNAWLFVGEDSFIPGKELEGLGVNDEKDVEKALPKDYSKKEAAGKQSKFHITVKEIKKKILPALNDEFACGAGNFKSMAGLRAAIKRNMENRSEVQQRQDLENQALMLLNKSAVFDAPQFMVERHLEALVRAGKKKLKKDGLSDADIKSAEKNLREKLKAEAVREVRIFFILEEIAKLEDITVDENGVNTALDSIADSSGRSREEVKKYYCENNMMDNLREDIKQRNVLDFIIKNSKKIASR